MNKLNKFMVMAAFCGALSACGNQSNSNGPATPLRTNSFDGINPNTCTQQATPQPVLHGHHHQQRCANDNVRPYNWQLGSGDVADGCSTGEIAACDAICGMVCVVETGLPDDYQIAWYNWNWQGQSSYSFYGYSSDSVYEQNRNDKADNGIFGHHDDHHGVQAPPASENPNGQIAQTCSISSPNCAVGTCRPIGSYDLGICSR
jgi:hypothetical protein